MVKLDLSAVQQSFETKHANELALIYRDSVKKVGAICGPDEVVRFFRLATIQSQMAQFELRGEIVKYAFISLHLGASFAKDPLYEDVRQSMLWGHTGVHPNVGLNRMFRSTDLMIADGLCAPCGGVTPGFGAACRSTRSGRPDAPIMAALEIFKETGPKRVHALGNDRVLESLEAYCTHLSSEDQKRRDFVIDWLICTYHLGFAFDQNPLFAWVPKALARDGLVELGSMLDG